MDGRPDESPPAQPALVVGRHIYRLRPGVSFEHSEGTVRIPGLDMVGAGASHPEALEDLAKKFHKEYHRLAHKDPFDRAEEENTFLDRAYRAIDLDYWHANLRHVYARLYTVAGRDEQGITLQHDDETLRCTWTELPPEAKTFKPGLTILATHAKQHDRIVKWLRMESLGFEDDG